MKRISVDNSIVKIHCNTQAKILDKAIQIIKKFKSGSLHARVLDCNRELSVLDVSRNDRIVIRNGVFNLLTHEKYNKFITRR